jgi:hypothetical protein
MWRLSGDFVMGDVWAVRNEPVPAATARLVSYLAAGGHGGIVEPGGLRVTPLSPTGAGVKVNVGSACLINNFVTGGGQQAYVVQARGAETVPVPATGSAGANYLVVARVYDGEYGNGGLNGKAPGEAFEIIPVGASTALTSTAADAYCQALPYPCEPLARLVIPANQGAITDSMITDVRRLMNPRSHREMFGHRTNAANMPNNGNAGGQFVTSTSMTRWTDYRPSIFVPKWATHITAQVTLPDVRVQMGSGGTANTNGTSGAVDLRLNGIIGDGWNCEYNLDASGPNALERTSITVLADRHIDAADRGKFHTLEIWGSRDSGKRGYLDAQNVDIMTDVWFTEKPEA